MKIEVRQNGTLWEAEVSTMEEIKTEILANPYNSLENKICIFDDGIPIWEGHISLLCNENEDSEFWFDVENSQNETLSEIERSCLARRI